MRQSLLVSASFAVIATIAPVQYANGQAAGPQGNGLVQEGDIVVTAQKRSQTLQNVPISISVLDGNVLTSRGQASLADSTRGVPGLSFIDLGPGQSQLSIRGISTGSVARDDTARKETVGVYFNETPVSVALFNPDLDPFDLARVEVLRGPQGTLYGAGSLSGTIRLISNQPDPGKIAGAFDTRLSATRHGGTNAAIRAMVNLPIATDRLALRVVGYHDYQDGFIDNLASGRKHVNDARKDGVRAALRFDATPDLTITPSFIWQRIETGGYPVDDVQSILGSTSDPAVIAGLPATRVATADPLVPGRTLIGNPVGTGYDQYRQRDEGLTDDFKVYNLQVNADLGGAALTSSSSLLDRSITASRDFTYFLDSLFGAGFDYSLPVSELRDETSLKTFVQELRLSSTGTSRLSWIAGLYYQHENRDYRQSILSPGFEALTGIPASTAGIGLDTLYIGTFDLRLRQFAAFGEARYQLTDSLSATAGLRWYDYTQTRDTRLRGLFNDLADTGQETSTSADGFTPKFLIEYKPSGSVLLSAQASKGFRLGGPSDPIPGICAADAAASGITSGEFKPEKLWNYELGFKTSWFARKLTVNGSVFQMNYDDLQLNRRLACSFTVTTNGGRARSRGVELELSARPVTGLTLAAGGSYVDAELRTDEPALNARAGDRLPLSPRLTANASLNYRVPLSDGLEAYADANWQHVGSVAAYFNTALAGAPPVDLFPNKVPAYDIVGLRVGIARGPIEFELFADNLFDERAALTVDRERTGFIVDSSVGRDARVGLVRNRPRTLGASLRGHF